MSAPLRFERVALPDVPWARLDALPGRTVYQTREWLDVLVETQRAEPVVALAHGPEGEEVWFTGAIVRRYGVPILGSPLAGWTTSYMGFTTDGTTPIETCLASLPPFAFATLGCVHVEVMDRRAAELADTPAGWNAGRLQGYELDLRRTDDELLAGMKSNGRRDVRRALRNGIVVEEVDPTVEPGFAAEYYEQVCQSFAKRDLVPTHPQSRIEAIVRHLHPTGRLLLLRARLEDGTPAATGIFLGLPGASAIYTFGASERALQQHLPNEALMWHALRTWRDRGAVRMDFGGGGTYKAKYGGTPIRVPWLRRSRVAALEQARTAAKRLARYAQVRAGRRSA